MDGLTKGKAQVQEAAFTNAFFFAYVCATRHYYLLDKFNEFSQVRKDVEEAREMYNKLVGEERGYI